MSNSLSAFFLGVDGGGSKTLAVIIDASGQERGRGIAGSSNYEAVGLAQAVAAIRQAVGQAVLAAQVETPVTAAWLGLAGVDYPGSVSALLPEVGSLANVVRITNDAELVLSALPDQIGVALIAGTGSIALGRGADGTVVRTGGWGHVMGDEGSGYAIGREALQHAVRAADGRAPATMLLGALLDFWELEAPESLLARVYQPFDKTTIAALAPVVLALAQRGDRVARHIEARAARELALAAATVARKLHFPSGLLPLAFGGGLLVHHERLRSLVAQRIERHAGGWRVAPVVVAEPVLSAARALARQGDDR